MAQDHQYGAPCEDWVHYFVVMVNEIISLTLTNGQRNSLTNPCWGAQGSIITSIEKSVQKEKIIKLNVNECYKNYFKQNNSDNWIKFMISGSDFQRLILFGYESGIKSPV